MVMDHVGMLMWLLRRCVGTTPILVLGTQPQRGGGGAQQEEDAPEPVRGTSPKSSCPSGLCNSPGPWATTTLGISTP